MEVNYCGHKCLNGSTTVTVILGRTDSFQPHVVFMNEVCQSQFNAITSQSQTAGHWALYGRFSVVKYRPSCGGTSGVPNFGDAILSHTNSFSNVGSQALTPGNDPAYPERVMCADVTSLAYPAVACVTHVTAQDDFSKVDQQIRRAKDFGLDRASGKPLALSGDFNLSPANQYLDQVYAGGPNSVGNFQEVDQCTSPNQRTGGGGVGASCNAWTKKADDDLSGAPFRKIDYIFLKQAYFKAMSGTVVHTTNSDHEILQGVATICSTATC